VRRQLRNSLPASAPRPSAMIMATTFPRHPRRPSVPAFQAAQTAAPRAQPALSVTTAHPVPLLWAALVSVMASPARGTESSWTAGARVVATVTILVLAVLPVPRKNTILEALDATVWLSDDDESVVENERKSGREKAHLPAILCGTLSVCNQQHVKLVLTRHTKPYPRPRGHFSVVTTRFRCIRQSYAHFLI